MILIIGAQDLFEFIICFFLNLAPLRSHNLKKDPFAEIDGNNMLTFRFLITILLLIFLRLRRYPSSRLNHLLRVSSRRSRHSWRPHLIISTS